MDADGCYCNIISTVNEYFEYKAYLRRLVSRGDVFLCFFTRRP